MRTKNMAPTVLVVLFAALFLAGCDTISLCLDHIDNPEVCIKAVALDESPVKVIKEKYFPADGWFPLTDWPVPFWLWIVMAIPTGYLLMRTPKSRIWAFRLAMGMVALAAIPFIWRVVEWWVAIIFIIGGSALASIVAKISGFISSIQGKAGWFYEKYKAGEAKMEKEFEEEMKRKGIQPEKEWGWLEILGGIGTLIVLAMLFGGELVEKPVKFWHQFDYALRVVGMAISAIGLYYFFFKELPKAKWDCVNPNCGQTTWDWGGNDKDCDHCGFPNPVLLGEWECRSIINPEKNYRCGEKNKGSDFSCVDCGSVRPQLKEWIEDERVSLRTPPLIPSAVSTPAQPQPPAQPQQVAPNPPPPPQPSANTIACTNCGAVLLASAKACNKCGRPTQRPTNPQSASQTGQQTPVSSSDQGDITDEWL